jgi:excisionase family DNA binding protein
MIEMFAGRRWLKISEAAAYLSVHSKTVYDWAARGLLPMARIGGTRRVDRLALDAGLERQSQAGQIKGKRP